MFSQDVKNMITEKVQKPFATFFDVVLIGSVFCLVFNFNSVLPFSLLVFSSQYWKK